MTNETHTQQDDEAAAPLGFGRVSTTAPIDAAIERHQDARGGLQRATDAVEAAGQADGAAWADLLATRPSDVLGAVRLLRYVSGSPASEAVEDVQDLLRQLTASVEAAEAGERQGGRVAEALPSGVVENPDPALTAVAEFRAAWDALAAAVEAAGGAGVPEVAPEIEDREGDAYERLKTVRPTTPEGFRALAGAWATVLAGERMGEPGIHHADHAADSLIAGAGVCVPLSSGPDPIEALIKAHLDARETWEPLAKVADTMLQTDPGYPAARAAADAAGGGEIAAYNALFSAQPTTLSGVLALANYLVATIPTVNTHTEPGDGDRALAAIAIALRAFKDVAPVAAPAVMQPDPVLAAIAASRAVEAEMKAFQVRSRGQEPAAWMERERELCKAQNETREAVWATVPTTHAGRIALIDYSRFQVDLLRGHDGQVDCAELILSEILAALEAAVRGERPEMVSAPATNPGEGELPNLDAPALVAAIEAEWAEQARVDDDAQPVGDAEAGYARRSALLSAANRLPADTRAARHAKALALAWIMYADLWRPGWSRDSYTTDGRLAFDINASLRVVLTAEHPDAGLLALGPMISELVAVSDRANALHADAEERSFEMIGPAPTKPKDIQLYPTDAAYHGAMQRYARECSKHAKRRVRAEKATNLTALEEAANEADSALLRETRRLADMRATTLEGLMFKARWIERGADEELKDGIVADLLAMRGGK